MPQPTAPPRDYHIYTEYLPGYTADSTVNSRQYEAEFLETTFQIRFKFHILIYFHLKNRVQGLF